LRIFLGLLLVTAAGLKAHQLATEATVGDGIMHSRWFILTVTECELLLGVWLLSGIARRASWAATVMCFVGFAVVSGYKIIEGESTCGCFGAVSVSPAQTIALDVVVLLALLVWRPLNNYSLSPQRGTVLFLVPIGGVMLTVALVCCLFIPGPPIEVAAVSLSFDAAPPIRDYRLPILIRNVTSSDVVVSGFASSCKCAVVRDAPVTVPAHGQLKIEAFLDLRPASDDAAQLRFRHYSATIAPQIIGTIRHPIWTIRGSIRSEYYVTPSVLGFGDRVTSDSVPTATAFIESHVPLRSVNVFARPPLGTATLTALDTIGHRFELVVAPMVGRMEPGSHFAFDVELRPIARDGVELYGPHITALGSVQNRVLAWPGIVNFGPVAVGSLLYSLEVHARRPGANSQQL
ncbi:MAG: hypothetical protein NUV77_25195, partial [Thermoguttaceae bacterium]|nr:hypothetical protein [Thermoguttaceae bacterium]